MKQRKELTMTGQIPSNVGFRSTQGHIRKLTLRDQLQRVINLRGVNTINHPVHGEIKISNDTARGLLDSKLTDAEIVRLKLKKVGSSFIFFKNFNK